MRLSVDLNPDPRVKVLAMKLKLSVPQTLGLLVCVWALCYSRRTVFVEVDDVDAAAEHEGFASAMVAAKLAEKVKRGAKHTIPVLLKRDPPKHVDIVVKAEADGVRVRGAAERIAYLFVQAERSKLGVDKRREIAAAKRPTGQPTGQPTGDRWVEPTGNPTGDPSSSSSDLVSASALAPVHPEPREEERESGSRRPTPRVPVPAGLRPGPEALKAAEGAGINIDHAMVRLRNHHEAKETRTTAAGWQSIADTWVTEDVQRAAARGHRGRVDIESNTDEDYAKGFE